MTFECDIERDHQLLECNITIHILLKLVQLVHGCEHDDDDDTGDYCTTNCK